MQMLYLGWFAIKIIIPNYGFQNVEINKLRICLLDFFSRRTKNCVLCEFNGKFCGVNTNLKQNKFQCEYEWMVERVLIPWTKSVQ